MTKIEKLELMDKVIRELDDISNSSSALLKKIAQAETENINLGNKLLDDKLPELFSQIDEIVVGASDLQTNFTEVRDKFYKENKLDEIPVLN